MNYEDMFNQAVGIRQPKRMSVEPDYSKYMSRADAPPVEVQPRQYTPMPLNQALDLDEKLKKSVAKKSLKKLKPEDKGMDLKGDLAKMGKDLGAQAAGEMTSSLLGGGTAGDTAGAVLSAGISSGFNPAIMGAAAVMGIVGGMEREKQAKRMGRARGQMELAKGQAEKTRIYGEMAKSVSQAFGGGSRKRSVNF
jgi:hypothetical protein